jgi:uncharacterized membrane protein
MVRDEAPGNWRNVRKPLWAIPAAFATWCLVATLATDIAYWATVNIMWADFSTWLVTAGVIVGYVALLVGLIELLTVRRLRRRLNWPVSIAYVVALILATIDMLVHTRDAWTSVVPWGLALSALVVLILLVTGWLQRTARETYDVRAAEVTS